MWWYLQSGNCFLFIALICKEVQFTIYTFQVSDMFNVVHFYPFVVITDYTFLEEIGFGKLAISGLVQVKYWIWVRISVYFFFEVSLSVVLMICIGFLYFRPR